MGARRNPEHHAPQIEIWAQEKPLPTAEMARASNSSNPTVETAYPNPEPALISAAQVSGDDAGRGFVRVTICPSDADRPCGFAWLDKAVPGELTLALTIPVVA
jgi:hypothetical protein